MENFFCFKKIIIDDVGICRFLIENVLKKYQIVDDICIDDNVYDVLHYLSENPRLLFEIISLSLTRQYLNRFESLEKFDAWNKIYNSNAQLYNLPASEVSRDIRQAKENKRVRLSLSNLSRIFNSKLGLLFMKL